MSQGLSPRLDALIAQRTPAVIAAAVHDLSNADVDVLPHALHRHAGTLATFGIPAADHVRALARRIADGCDQASVRRELASLIGELRLLLSNDDVRSTSSCALGGREENE